MTDLDRFQVIMDRFGDHPVADFEDQPRHSIGHFIDVLDRVGGEGAEAGAAGFPQEAAGETKEEAKP